MATAEHFDLSSFQLDHELVADGRSVVAVADPEQIFMIDEISFLLNQRVVATVSPLEQICDVLTRTERGR